MNLIEIYKNEYEVIDTLNNITLADSFLLNKTGTGNGEAKMYVGNESKIISTFFSPFIPLQDKNGFFLISDFKNMLDNLKEEYLKPQQQYLKSKRILGEKVSVNVTDEMPEKWKKLHEKVKVMETIQPFNFFRSDIEPPRTYINSNSEIYKLLREIGIPNISYCSILKLRDIKDDKIVYYFKPFVDYSNTIEGYLSPTIEEQKEIENISKTDKSATVKERLINARIGQGKYREQLLEDMPYCPFTKINDERILIASHIKPWAKSSDKEKTDPQNGLTLSPTFDKLFDKGLISFESDGTLLVSPFLSPMNQKRLNIATGQKIRIEIFFTEKRIKYLEFHREYIFQTVNM